MIYPDGTTTRPDVSSPYGPRSASIGISNFHAGADLIGFTTVHAIAPGKVTFAGWMNAAAGYTVVIDHGDGVRSLYMHNRDHTVTRGQNVTEGQPIAVMGQTGNATGPCVHLEVRVGGRHVDPLAYIAARLTRNTKEEDEMILFIKGKAGARRGGLYYITGGRAVFLGSHAGKNFPTLTDETEIRQLQRHVDGIG